MTERKWKRRGIARLRSAIRHQRDGIFFGLVHDSAIRQVSVVCCALSIGALFLPVPLINRAFLVAVTLLVVVMEYINSALEATVDRISTDEHPLSKQAKDFGSVAVGLTALIAFVAWAAVVFPLFQRM